MVKIEDLKRITLLKDVPDHLLQIIAGEAQLSIFGEGTELLSIGDDVTTYFMLVMGQVAVKQPLAEDIDVILDFIQSGGSFGSSAFIAGSKANYNAVCQETCEVITVSGQKMQSLFESSDELAYHVMSGVAIQYKSSMDQRAQMILDTLDDNPDIAGQINDIENLTLTI